MQKFSKIKDYEKYDFLFYKVTVISLIDVLLLNWFYVSYINRNKQKNILKSIYS